MQYMSLSAAAVLLYTSPAFVILMSGPLFKEKITLTKLAAVVIAFLGCAFLSGLGEGELVFSPKGLVFGILSGFGYALYSIFGRFALNRGYGSLTVNVYSTLLAGLGSAIIDGFAAYPIMFSSLHIGVFCVLAGVITCFLPYFLYIYGLNGMENGRAAVIASIEPVVATLVGILIFGEAISFFGLLGIALVLTAIALMSGKK